MPKVSLQCYTELRPIVRIAVHYTVVNAHYKKQLEKNIVKYSWYQIFTKRVYLPLIAIQLVDEGQVTVAQLAIIAVVASVVQLVLQMPSGYIADKFGNKVAIVTGASIAATAPLFYVFMPNFWGGLLAAVLFFGGIAFQSGAKEAFMHDTLTALKKDRLYAKIMGRAQSYGLVGNVILLALVPATYSINKNLPFLIGFICSVVMLAIALRFTYPKNHVKPQHKMSPIHATKSIVTLQNLALFLFAGFVAGIVHKVNGFSELLLQDVGVAVALFGVLLAVSSLVGAVMGLFTGALIKLKPLAFYVLDLAFVTSCLLALSTKYIPVVVGGYILYYAYSRVRHIMFQAYLLQQINHRYKATLLSALGVFNLFGEIFAVVVLAKLISIYDYSIGFRYFALYTFVVGMALIGLIVLESKRPSKMHG